LPEFTADHAEYAEVERGRIRANSFSPYSAVLAPPGCRLFGRFFTTDFTDFTDGKPAAFYAMHFERGNLQGADWQRLSLNDRGKGGENGRGMIGNGMKNAATASGQSGGR
jgi:hypothetical protein